MILKTVNVRVEGLLLVIFLATGDGGRHVVDGSTAVEMDETKDALVQAACS